MVVVMVCVDVFPYNIYILFHNLFFIVLAFLLKATLGPSRSEDGYVACISPSWSHRIGALLCQHVCIIQLYVVWLLA
jgi:hypothetical protein